ncbi:MAG: hypothetical protein ACE141_03015 [Bryobacteraceae bacterium]
MSMTTVRAALLIALLLPALSSCRLFRKSKPAPPPAKIPAQTQPSPAPPPQLEPPPQLSPSAETQEPAGLPGQITEPLPPPPPEEKKRPSRASPRAPAPAESSAPAPAAPAPQLRPMLTAAQQQALERSITDRIARAQNTLAALAGRRLNSEQEDLAGQVRTFIRQAEEARATDLLRANNLAERAEVLAAELAKRLR